MNKKIMMLSTLAILSSIMIKLLNAKEYKGKPIMKNTSQKDILMQRYTLPSGLSYIIQQAAPQENALKPQKGQQVTVHYTGWLSQQGEPGTKFDSSVDRKQKFTFTIGMGQVIKGWDEGVMDMKVGEKRRLYIPSSLGYGSYGAGSVIPPHADLIFDVELFAVQ
jgi:FKBP-type peptidyl-prolyl cis-trans isomerase FkpA